MFTQEVGKTLIQEKGDTGRSGHRNLLHEGNYEFFQARYRLKNQLFSHPQHPLDSLLLEEGELEMGELAHQINHQFIVVAHNTVQLAKYQVARDRTRLYYLFVWT